MFQNNMSHWLSLTSMSPSWLLFRRVAGVSERNLHQRRRWSHLLRLLNPPAALLHVRKKKQVFLWHFSRWSCTNRQSTMVGIFLNNKAEIWPALSMEISKKKIESKPSHQIFRGKKTVGKVTTHNLHRNPTSWWAKNSNLLTSWWTKIQSGEMNFLTTKGHYITNPNNALLWGKSLKSTIHFAFFDPPKSG